MMRQPSRVPFVIANVVMWAVMTAILTVVPDALGRWLPLDLGRIVAWAVASGLWVVVLQQPWRARLGPFPLFFVQVALWVSAALLAIWISDAVRIPVFVE